MKQDPTKKEPKNFSCVAPSIPGPPTDDNHSDSTNVVFYRDSESCAAAKDPELFECGSYLDCTNCTKHQNCMWCGSLNVCVSNEAYVTSFPFGQCYEWFQRQNCQRTSCSGFGSKFMVRNLLVLNESNFFMNRAFLSTRICRRWF